VGGEPNILSYLVFFLWVPFCFWGMRRWPPAKATAILFFAGLLFLPERVSFKLPGVPKFDKPAIIILWIFVALLVFHRQRFRTAPFSWQFKWCAGLMLGGAVFTVLLNGDPISIGSSYIPGHQPYDAVHIVVRSTLVSILPFVVGVTMFRSGSELRVLLRVFVSAALVYSVLQIIEMVMSPQMHRWVYGFSQAAFMHTMRGGGYRPMVFMVNGLALALFTSLATIAAAALYKVGDRPFRVPTVWVAGYLWLILFASRSIAALLYSIVALPMVFFTSPKRQVWLATALAATLFVYPAARAQGLIPIDDINAIVLEQFGVDKVGSLTVRFENEAALLERAAERLWFGWGRYCRACLYDPWSGDLMSIRDGAWIGALGDFGLVGFLGRFGLLVFPIFVLFRRLGSAPTKNDRRLLAAMTLMLGWSAFDLIPNGNFNQLAMVLSGALYGSFIGILQEANVVRRRNQIERIQAAQRVREVPA
jgi:hypothetical protein